MSLRTRIEAEIGPLTDWVQFRDLLIDVLVEAGYAGAAAPIRSVYSPTLHDDPRAIADLIVLVADVTDKAAQNALYSVAHMSNAAAANIYRQLLTIADTQLEGVGGGGDTPPAGFGWLTDFEGNSLYDADGVRLYGAI